MPTLDQVALHTRVRVVAVRGARHFRRRLLEMGLVPGTVVVPVNRAPLGDPLELRLRGGRLSIRVAQAAEIDIEALL